MSVSAVTTPSYTPPPAPPAPVKRAGNDSDGDHDGSKGVAPAPVSNNNTGGNNGGGVNVVA